MRETSQNIAIITTTPDFHVALVNTGYQRFATKFGLEAAEGDIFGKPFAEIFPERHRKETAEILQAIHGKDETWSWEERLGAYLSFQTDGGKFFAQVFLLVGPDGVGNGYLFIFSSPEEATLDPREVEGSLTSIMDGMGDAVVIVDENCEITYMNKITREIFGSPPLGSKFHTAFPGNDALCPRCNIKSFGDGDVTREVESKNGRFFLATFSPVIERGGRKAVIGALKDITFSKRMEEELKKLTITDNLTKLYNKRHFLARLKEETGRARRQGNILSILFADIDGFKKFNETHGYIEGDALLARMGEAFLSVIRKTVDSAFRYGGDEFFAILPEASAKDAARVAERIRERFTATTGAGTTAGVKVSVSMGVIQFKDDPALEGLIDRADRALYEAKDMGGGCVIIGD